MIKIIFHVDKDSSTRNSIKKALENSGYAVVSLASSRACLSKMGQMRPDLILLDIDSSSESPWEQYKTIRWGDNRIRVIFTGKVEISEARMAALRENGVSGYFLKPFDERGIVSEIRKIIGD